MRTARYWIIGALCGAAAVGLVIMLYIVPQDRADQAAARADQANRDRIEAQTAQCHQFNVQVGQTVAGDKAEIRILVAALAPNPSPAIERRIQDFYPRYDRVVDITHPKRDCTPAGIAKYLRQKP